MRASYLYLYNIGNRDIEKHLQRLESEVIERRTYNDGKQVKTPRKQTHQRKVFNYDV